MTNDIIEKSMLQKKQGKKGKNRPILISFNFGTSMNNQIIDKKLLERLQQMEKKPEKKLKGGTENASRKKI
jgi:hypothetical protein